MHCNVCRAQLSGGAAYCPTCGSVTPYHISLSGVTPSEPTIASLYAPSAPPPSPQPEPSFASPPPPRRRLRRSVGWVILLVALVLLVVGTGIALFFRTTPPSLQLLPNPSP